MSSGGYDEDFEDYDDDFESDHELEVPHRLSNDSTAIAGISGDAWPSLTAAAAVKHKPRAATFSRSLITSGFPPTAASDGISVTVSPAPTPLTDSQRSRAAKTLSRALQRKQQLSLALTPMYDLLVLQPLSAYQQLAQGVGVFAEMRAAACQTGQLGQELQEQDTQTEQVELQDGYCQVPDIKNSISSKHKQQPAVNPTSINGYSNGFDAKSAAATRLLESDVSLVNFLDWAVPEVVSELSKAAATASIAAEGARTASNYQKQLPFTPTSFVQGACNPAAKQAGTALVTGQLLLQCSNLLAGRTVISVTCPPTFAAATTAAAAISSAVASPVSNHLLLSCCSPVAMSAEAALKEHGIPGLGCLCIWDLMQQQQQQQPGASAAGSGSVPVQVLVSEGRPSCCCWGIGAGSHLVFAGMQEGGICCWDLSEVSSKHRQLQQLEVSKQQQQQQLWPTPRRPSYSTEVPMSVTTSGAGDSSSSSSIFSGSGVDRRTAVAAVQPAGGLSSSTAGAVCQLITLSSTGNITLFSVMVAATAAAAAAVAGLGMRTGSRVWLVKTVEGLPLGLNAAKPPHLRTTLPAAAVGDASALSVLPGASQQLLVGVSGARILKGTCLGTPRPPREYIAEEWHTLGSGYNSSTTYSSSSAVSSAKGSGAPDTAAVNDRLLLSSSSRVFGSVVSLSVNSVLGEALLAGLSSGGVALFDINKSRPVLLWQQLRPAAVVAVRWIPTRPCVFLVLHSDGQLSVVDLAQNTKQPTCMANLQRSRLCREAAMADVAHRAMSATASMPCSMEALVSHNGGTTTALPTEDNSSIFGRARQLRSSTSKISHSRSAADQGGRSSTAPQCCIAVGYDDGTTLVYRLGLDGNSLTPDMDERQQLQTVLGI